MNERAGKELEQCQMRNNKLMQESEQHSVMFEEVMQDIQQKTAELKVSTRRCMHLISCITLTAVLPLGTRMSSVLELIVPYEQFWRKSEEFLGIDLAVTGCHSFCGSTMVQSLTLSPDSVAPVLLDELCFIKHVKQNAQHIVLMKDAWYF